MKWIKASEQLPPSLEMSDVHYKVNGFKESGYITQTEDGFVFEYRSGGSYSTIDDLSKVEWLDETPSIKGEEQQEVKEEEVYEKVLGILANSCEHEGYCKLDGCQYKGNTICKVTQNDAKEIMQLFSQPIREQWSEERNAYKLALEKIVDPIKFLREEAEKEGGNLNGVMALQVSNDANYLKSIAYTALNPE